MSREFDVKMGAILKSVREERHMSLQYVGDRMNLTRGCIHNYERGNRVVTYETLLKLCEVYGIEDVNEVTNQLRKLKVNEH